MIIMIKNNTCLNLLESTWFLPPSFLPMSLPKAVTGSPNKKEREREREVNMDLRVRLGSEIK